MFNTKECIALISSKDQNVFHMILRLMMFLRIVNDEIKVRDIQKSDVGATVWPNCHSACRALRIHLGDLVSVVDGSIIGASQYVVLNDEDETVYQKLDLSIQHSWLELPDGAMVDPYPAGAYATSPILFPAFGHYQDVFPASVYIPHQDCGYAKTDKVWKRSENIAHVLSYFPFSFEQMCSTKLEDLRKEMQLCAGNAAEYVLTSSA